MTIRFLLRSLIYSFKSIYFGLMAILAGIRHLDVVNFDFSARNFNDC